MPAHNTGLVCSVIADVSLREMSSAGDDVLRSRQWGHEIDHRQRGNAGHRTVDDDGSVAASSIGHHGLRCPRTACDGSGPSLPVRRSSRTPNQTRMSMARTGGSDGVEPADSGFTVRAVGGPSPRTTADWCGRYAGLQRVGRSARIEHGCCRALAVLADSVVTTGATRLGSATRVRVDATETCRGICRQSMSHTAETASEPQVGRLRVTA